MILPYPIENGEGKHPLIEKVDPSEWCFCVKVDDIPTQQPGEGHHRYRVTTVVRSSLLSLGYLMYDYWEDWGLAPKNRLECPFWVIGGFYHPDGKLEVVETVARLWDETDDMREGIDPRVLELMPNQGDELIQAHYDEPLRRKWGSVGRTTFS